METTKRILVVDDEKEIADILEIYLVNDGCTVHKFYTGMEALKCMEETELDLAILDVMLPDMDGFQICKRIREKYFYPVIMLTARTTDNLAGMPVWTPYAMVAANILEIPLFFFLAVRSYCRHSLRNP